MSNNSNNNHWRGNSRGGGRSGGGGNRGYDDNNYDNRSSNYNNTSNNRNAYNNNNSGSNAPITSRLGPMSNTNNGPSQQQQPKTSNFGGNQRGGGRAFSSNNYRGNRGGGRGGRGAHQNNPRFNNEFVEEDTNMNSNNTLASNVVTVSGYPAGSEEKVLGFLARKAKVAWEPINVQYEAQQMHITVADDLVASNLCRMNNFTFGAATLQLVQGGKGQGSNNNSRSNDRTGGNNHRNDNNTAPRSAILAEFLQERWNAQAGFLDMEDLPPTAHNISVMVSKLLDEAKYLFGEELKTISFARNKLWSVVPLIKTAEFFPNLQNLSIADNDIAEFRSLDKLSKKFNCLQELMLSGNPIQLNNPIQTYQAEVLKRFPTILFLDMQPVNGTGGGAIQQQQQQNLPAPVRSSFFDQDSSRIATQDLLSKYFPMFDSNRNNLMDLYDEQAIFSSTFSSGTFQQQNVWGSSQVTPGQRMVVGNQNIITRLLSLPATAHDLSSADNFVTDAWQTPGSQNYPVVLFIIVHGEFIESPTGTPLSFDRTFLVAPSAPGSRAHTAGWSYVILSDSFIVRNYSCKPGSLITA